MCPKPRFRYDYLSHRLIPIQELAPGKAFGCNEFSNRGLGAEYNEVTVWPKQVHYHLTTGEGHSCTMTPRPVELNSTEKQICRILGLREWELGTFLKSWEPDFDHAGSTGANSIPRPQEISEYRRALEFFGRGRDQCSDMKRGRDSVKRKRKDNPDQS
jgi:hypothetical protein